MPNTWTLLITDDCAEDREIYREYLSRDPGQSYQILEAASAEVGLELCQHEHCDAILLDFSLPDMTGLEFLDELRQQRSQAPLPVIMLTGQGDERIAVQAMKRGAQEYLVKQHLQPDILQLTVRSVIEQSSSQTQSTPIPEQLRGRHPLTAEIALRIRQSLNLEDILQAAVTEVRQLLECDRVAVYKGTGNGQPANGQANDQLLHKVCETGSTLAIADPVQKFARVLEETDPPSTSEPVSGVPAEYPPAAIVVFPQGKKAATFLVAPIVLPLIDQSTDRSVLANSVWGLLIACQGDTKRQWQADEVHLLEELAGQVAIAIAQAERLHEALTALETERQLNALRSQFVATVSHEYRTPLSAILAAATTLKLHGDKLQGAKQQRFLQTIEDKARQMTQLVDDLLTIETFECGKVDFLPLPFELLQFVSDIVEEQRSTLMGIVPTAGMAHPELTFKITGNTRGFWGDQKLLRRILVNLLSNAIKYSPQGGMVELHLQGTDSHIIFDITDEGIGIPQDNQIHLFQPFNRGKNVGDIPGTGMGLTIVKACVHLHAGDIAIASEEGGGTRVTVRLPKRSPAYSSTETEGKSQS